MTKRHRVAEMKFPEYHDAPTEGCCSFIAEVQVGYFVIATCYTTREGITLGPFPTMKEAKAELDSLERRLSDDGLAEVILQ